MFGFVILALAVSQAHPAMLENPSDGASYSGIGVISGWKCEAEGSLTIVFNDDGQHIPLLYGTERTDVRANGQCLDNNHDNVGFVAIWNWGNLGDGEHTAVAYDNGVEFVESTFTVTTLGTEFGVDLEGACTIANFPSPGETARFAWNEATQHLELVRRSPSCRPEDEVHIPDAVLRAAVEEELGKAAGMPITTGEMATVMSITAGESGVESLVGLECAANVRVLRLNHNQITDVSPLSGLTGLETLTLQYNQITDVAPLSGLTGLEWLNLFANQITDVSPLAGLTGLETLHLGDNRIMDVAPLADLTGLELLSLQRNRITDVAPLADLTRLETLNLAANRITDVVPLADLTRLETLYLSRNQIADIGPLVSNSGLNHGDFLGLPRNPLNARSLNEHIPALEARGVEVNF